MEYLAEEKGVEVHRIDQMSRRIAPLRDLISLGRIVRVLYHEKPTVLHTHTAKAGVLGRLAAMITGVPVRVHTFHGHVFEGYFSRPVARVFIWIERALARHTDCIIAVSDRQCFDLAHRYRIADESKITVVPLGIELQPFLDGDGDAASLRNHVGCSEAQPLVGWVGRFALVKNPSLFVEAAHACADRTSASFVMVGDGALWAATAQLAEARGLRGVMHLVGSRADMPNVYAALDVLALTSTNEGTPVALLEAMASGKPVVATEVGGIADLMIGTARLMPGFRIFDNGILAESTPSAIAAAIAYLVERPQLRREMGSAGRSFVANRYSSHRLADDLERLYHRLALAKGSQYDYPRAWAERPAAHQPTGAITSGARTE